MTTPQIESLAAAIVQACGTPSTWAIPATYGYPNSLALCVIDSIQSTGIKYGVVERVVKAYEAHRGAAAATDGAPELLGTFADLGEDRWVTTIGTRNRTYARSYAPFKAYVIHLAAALLTSRGVHTTADFREAAQDNALRAEWTALPSQSSAVTWHYAHMLAGTSGVKPDRMVRRFTAEALGVPGHSLTEPDLIGLVTGAADALNADVTATDHMIWKYASGRISKRGGPARR